MAIRTPIRLLTLACAAALAALGLALPEGARAGCTTQKIGGTSFHNCDDGTTGTSQRIGDTTFHHFDGESGASLKLGGTVFHHLGGKSGTSQRIGGTTFHHLDGVSGTSQRIGGTTFHSFSDGTSGTSQQIGGTTFLNLEPGRSPHAGRIPLLQTGREEAERDGWPGLHPRVSPRPAAHPPPFRIPSFGRQDEGRPAPFPVFAPSVGGGSTEGNGAEPFGLDLWD